MAPKPTMSELRADAAADAKMESAVEAQTEAQLMQSYPKAKPEKPAGHILRDAMDAVKSTIAAGTRPLSPRVAPPGSSKDVDAMSDGSFEKVEEDVVMVTEADYDLAEKVATQHKNEEDSASLELAGQTTEDFTFLAESSHLDVQKSLADLEEAIAKLSTKDTEETKVSEESSTLPGPAQGDRGEGSVSKDTFVAFDRTPDGSYKITNTATDWPLVPGHIRSKLRNFTIGELYDLMSIFKEATSLTESTFHRILEVYALQVMKLQHTHILEADHVRKRDASVVHKLDPGAEISDYWGRMAALLLRITYLIFYEVDWGFVFVDDFCWILRTESANLWATTILATYLALGVPLSWKKTVLSEVNTWLGFVVNPRTLVVRMAQDKHDIIMEILQKLSQGETFTSKAIEKALGRINWATSVCPLSRPFLQPFWAWKTACKSSGKPPKLVCLFARMLSHIFSVPYHQPSPYLGTSPWWGASDASATKDMATGYPMIGGWISDLEFPDKKAVWWFQITITPEDCPWAFVERDSSRRIAALEMLGTLLLATCLIQQGHSSLLRLQLALMSDNQGNVYALLNQQTRKMPTAAFLMQLVSLLYDRGAQLAPHHCKRDHNQWADDLTHPDPVGFTPERRLSLTPVFEAFTLLPQILPDWKTPSLHTSPRRWRSWGDPIILPTHDPLGSLVGAAELFCVGWMKFWWHHLTSLILI